MKTLQASTALFAAILLQLSSETTSYTVGSSSNSNNNNGAVSRRGLGSQMFRGLVAGTVAANTLAASAPVAVAVDGDDLVDVYYGVGCFWHIQHEFVDAERKLLSRGDHELTSRAGYAGGKTTDKEGRVCYHNFQSVADYGKLGHGEVVGMKLPAKKVGDFASVYFSLFDPRTKDRVDPMDRGGEYRSLIGIPGGVSSSLYAGVEKAAQDAGFQLAEGKGNDPDTLGKKLIYVYDTKKFPFYQAEVYHQFHNDFQSPDYGKTYNNLANVALEDGRVQGTGCPDRV